MKEATGELNMTVITLIAIAAIAALFYVFVWPMIQRSIVNQTCKTYGDYTATNKKTTGCIEADTSSSDTGTKASVKQWYCCPASS